MAKSVLILIPVFGLHFVLFAWSPYAEMSITLTIVFNYIESVFNAFQGIVVAVACCFIQRDVRVEALIFLYKCFKSAACYRKFPYCKCFNPDPDYLTKLRQRYRDRGAISKTAGSFGSIYDNNRRSLGNVFETHNDGLSCNSSSRGASLIVNSDLNSVSTYSALIPKKNAVNKKVKEKNKIKVISKKNSLVSLHSINSQSNKCFSSVCYDCLFDKNTRNDFYQSTHRHTSKKRNSSDFSIKILNINGSIKKKNALINIDNTKAGYIQATAISKTLEKDTKRNKSSNSIIQNDEEQLNSNDLLILNNTCNNDSKAISKAVHFNELDSAKVTIEHAKTPSKSNIKNKNKQMLINDNFENKGEPISNLNKFPLLFESINEYIDEDFEV